MQEDKVSTDNAPRSLLSLLRDQGPQPMAQLSESLGVSRSKTGQDVAELGRLGLVTRGGRAPSRGGRPSSIVALSDRTRYAGVDIGATSIAVAVTDAYLKVIDFVEEDADVREGPEPLLKRAVELVTQLAADGDGQPAAVGVGVPGPVRFRDGNLVGPPLMMPGWERFPIRDHLEVELGVPVVVDNDVNVMALGELHAGAARGSLDVLFLKLGTGPGCGIIVNGSLYRGVDGCAGEISHVRVPDSTALCYCGNTGCLCAEFGGAALARQAVVAAHSNESPILARYLEEQGVLTAIDVGRASAAGDPTAARLIRNGGRVVGEVLAGLVSFFNPSKIVVGGGLSNLGPLLLAEIRSATLQRSTPLATAHLAIELSKLRNRAGVVGGAWLASERFIEGIDSATGSEAFADTSAGAA